MGGGRQYVFLCGDSHPTKETVYFPRALQLFGKTAEYLLAGLLKQYPVELSVENMQEVAGCNELVLLAFGTDRCATEFSMLKFIWERCYRTCCLNILPHAEPCGTHGVALVKGRHGESKVVTKMQHGFSRLARQGKDLQEMHESLFRAVAYGAAYVVGAAPDAVKSARKASSANQMRRKQTTQLLTFQNAFERLVFPELLQFPKNIILKTS